jgi:hypothetical protein
MLFIEHLRFYILLLTEFIGLTRFFELICSSSFKKGLLKKL